MTAQRPLTEREAAGEAIGNVVALVTAIDHRESVLDVIRELDVRQLQNALETAAGMIHAALYEVADARGDEPDPELGTIGGWLVNTGLDAACMRVGLPVPPPAAEHAP